MVLKGRHRGTPFQLQLEEGGNVWLRIPLQSELPPGFLLTREPSEASARARSDVQVGDPELDRLLRIEAANPAAAIRLLRAPALKAPLLALFAHPGAEVQRGEVRLGPWRNPSPGALRPAVADACAAASVLDASAGELSASYAARVSQAREEPAPALEGRRFVALLPAAELRWIEAFRRARERVLAFGVPSLVIGAVWAVGGVQEHRKIEQYAGTVILLVSVTVLTWAGTCPSCRKELHGFRIWFSRRPQSCPKCGVRLR